MSNKVAIFENEQFGKVRTINKQGEPWFVAKDIALALGYAKPENAVAQHVEKEDKTSTLFQGSGSNYKSKTVIINESGLYALIFGSKLDSAKAFKHWVTSEVLPSIRKTGKYETDALKQQRVETAQINANARRATLLLKIAETTKTDYKQVLQAHATKLLTGEFLLPLPEVNERTYSAGEIGELLGVSAQKIGRLSNENGMKTSFYGKWFYDKAKSADKQVETFRYYEHAIAVFEKLLSAVV